jgi:hypothetical protein
MFTKKTVIGIGIGSLAIVLGSYFLIIAISSNTHQVNDVIGISQNDVFKFYAEKHFSEHLNINGTSFHVKLKTPSDGLQVDNDFKKEICFDWISLENGEHFINITNTGDSILHVSGKLNATTNSLIITSHLIVISSGVLIIGISAAFSIRKPRGF